MNYKFTCSSNWIKESSDEETIEFLRQLALRHAEEAGPNRLPIKKMLLDRDWAGLISFPLDYSRGHVGELLHARQAIGFFEKLNCLPLGINTEEVAWKKFLAAEENCLETNRRLRSARVDGFKTPSAVASVIFTAQRKIQQILGDVPSLDDLQFSFGPGANTTVKATASSARWKLNAQLECSAELTPVLGHILSQFPHWVEVNRSHSGLLGRLEDHLDRVSVPVSVGPGKLSFVDKNAKTKRSIVVEPILNSVCQKGIGKYIRRMLRKVGIDLKTQAQRNKFLAQRSSFDGSLATVDLSAASDTISKEVVAELLPHEWYEFLSRFRTGTVIYKDDTIHLQKFSSMGNAFTFELETLIFWAIAWASTYCQNYDTSEVSCFGDDILLPTEAYPLLLETLTFLGFTINEEKTFADGPFRESCGGDFVYGFDIRPFYQKDLISGRTLFILHNFYKRNLEFGFANMVLEAVPESLRIWGPDGYGDGHLVGDWQQATYLKPKQLERGFGGVLFDTFTLKSKVNTKPCYRGDRVLPHYSIYVAELPEDDFECLHEMGMNQPLSYWSFEDPSNHFAVRGVAGYRRVQIYTLCTSVFRRD